MKTPNDSLTILALKNLPAIQTVDLLRWIALQLLEAILQNDPRSSPPKLQELLSPDDTDLIISTISPAIIINGKRRFRRLLDMGPRNLLRLQFDSYVRNDRRNENHRLTIMTLQGKLSPSVWTNHAADDLQRRYDLDTANRFPQDFWRLLGLYAWTDSAFQKQTAYLLERSLRQRALFDLEEFSTIILAPECYWLLIGLAASRIDFDWTYQLWPVRRRQRLAIQRLQAEATRLGLKSGWASGWEQWVLLEAWRKWGDKHSSPAIMEALRTLPLRGSTAGHRSSLTLSDWEKATPAWFLAWNRIYQKNSEEVFR